MKNYLTLLFCFFFYGALAQDYTVLFVQGQVKNAGTTKPLKVGEKLTNEDEIIFTSKSDVLGLINAKGRYTVRIKGVEEEGDAIKLSKYLQPAKNRMNMPRQNNPLQDLQRNFDLNSYVVLDTGTSLLINPVAFPMNKSSYFYVTYEYEGKEVNKKLPFLRNKLIISEQLIYGTHNPKKIKEVYLFYYNFNKDDSTLISAFVLNFLKEQKKLKEELNVLINLLVSKKATKAEICSEATNFINEYYGNISTDDLYKWLDKNYQIHNY